MATSDLSTANVLLPMELPLMSFAGASRVRIYPQLESALASKVRDLVSGYPKDDLFVFFDRSTQSWRTFQACLVSGWTPFSGTWPRSGTMRLGIVSRLPPSAPLIRGIGSGSSPVPTPRPCSGLRSSGMNRTEIMDALEEWATPTARDFRSPKRLTINKRGMKRRQLNEQVAHFPTPSVKGNHNRKGASATSGDGLATVVGGALNPTWVEWLMGFPLGWTDLGASATQLSRRSSKKSAAQSSKPKA